MSSEGQRDAHTKKPQSGRAGQGRGVADIWMKHGPLMGEGEYWVRQRQMECERWRERNSDICLLTSTLFSANQYREMHVSVCVSVCGGGWFLFGGRQVLSASLSINITTTVTLPRPWVTPPRPPNLCTCLYLISDPVILSKTEGSGALTVLVAELGEETGRGNTRETSAVHKWLLQVRHIMCPLSMFVQMLSVCFIRL